MDLMELLKAIFNGEALTFEQFSERVESSADVKLGNLAGGQYVDKHKFEDVSKQLEDANANLADYDPDWKTKLADAEALGDKKLNDYKFEQAIEKAINEAGAADVVSVKANIDMSTVTQDENGAISGLSEQLEQLKTEKPFLFKTGAPESKLNLGGPTPGAKKKKSGSIRAAVENYYKN